MTADVRVTAQPKPKPRPQYSTAPSSNIATPSRRRIPFFLAAETVELYALVEWLCCGCFEDSGLLFRRRYVACDLSGDQLACPTWWMDLSGWTSHQMSLAVFQVGYNRLSIFMAKRKGRSKGPHRSDHLRMFKELPTCSKIVTIFDI
ncbi:uncharacterized protein LOC144166228 [Haemaphysalis longicornis]